MSMTRLSIVLPYYKRLRAFEHAMRVNYANFASTPERSTEVVLVLDEPSEEEAVLQVINGYSQLSWRVIINRREHLWRNPASAINVGIRHAEGDFILVMSPESLHVTNVPKTLFERSSISDSFIAIGRICWCPRQVIDEKGLTGSFEETEPKRYYGSVCGPRAAFEAVRGYDESNKTWGCDDDNIRARFMLNGLKLKYTPLARAIHPLEAGEVNYNRIRQREKTSVERDLYLVPASSRVNVNDWGREFNEVVFERKGSGLVGRERS